MRKLLVVIVLLLVTIAVLGFYRGWFRLSTENADQQPSAYIHGGPKQNQRRQGYRQGKSTRVRGQNETRNDRWRHQKGQMREMRISEAALQVVVCPEGDKTALDSWSVRKIVHTQKGG